MANVLVLYSTTDGHTLAICRRMQPVIEQGGNKVTLLALEDAGQVSLTEFDKIVIGASIRYGKLRPLVYEFVNTNASLLGSRPSAFFTVNAVARKAGKDSPETNPYMIKFLQRSVWRPAQLAVFAGKIDYPRYSFRDRQIIRFIMWLTGGPTDPKSVTEFTNWQAVERFAKVIARM